jgi:hypothetical protein
VRKKQTQLREVGHMDFYKLYNSSSFFIFRMRFDGGLFSISVSQKHYKSAYFWKASEIYEKFYVEWQINFAAPAKYLMFAKI